MMTKNSTMRSWIIPTVCSLTTICLLLISSGCRVSQSGQNPIGWRDWLPRSHRGLVRMRLQPRQESTIPTTRESAAADSAEINPAKDLATSSKEIAPAPPTAKTSTSPLAPSPETDIQDLVAIDKDLPSLETTPEASSTVEIETKQVETTTDNEPAETTTDNEPAETTTDKEPAEIKPAETTTDKEPTNQAEPNGEAADNKPLLEKPSDRPREPIKESPEDAVNSQSNLQPQIEAAELRPIVRQPKPNTEANAAVAPEPALLPTLPQQLTNEPGDADKEIARKILEHFKQLKEQGVLHHFAISVHVANGTAELKGQLISQAQHDTVVESVRAIEGVEKIENRLLIKALDLDATQEEAEAGTSEEKEAADVTEPTTAAVKKPVELPDPVEEDLFNIR